MNYAIDPHKTYNERGVKDLGITEEIIKELEGDLFFRERFQKGEFFGALLLNALMRSCYINGESSGRIYVNAYKFAEVMGLRYSDVIAREHNKLPLAVRCKFNGAEDLGIPVRELHKIFKLEEGKDELSSLVIKYQDTKYPKILDSIYDTLREFLDSTVTLYRKKNAYHSYEELMSSAFLGLLDAIESFDRNMGVKFKTHIWSRIKGRMIDEAREFDSLPRSIRSKEKLLEKAESSYFTKFGVTPEPEELSRITGLSFEEIIEVKALVRFANAQSLDQKLGQGYASEDEEGAELWRTIPSGSEPNPVDVTIANELEEIIADELKRCGENGIDKRSAIIFERYVLGKMTMAEIGEEFGITESRVCQILSDRNIELKIRKRLGLMPQKVMRLQV